MTSANTTHFRIERNGVVVGEHSQHHYCYTKWHRLYKFTPFNEHTIIKHWLDEDEVYHEEKPVNLSDFLKSKKISIGDMRRMVSHIEKQNSILKKWVEKFGTQDPALKLTSLNSISYSPL